MRVGCDIVELSGFGPRLERKGFIATYFHENEIKYCEGAAHREAAFAARLAAKEAFVKALGTGFFQRSVTPADVWVEADGENPSGRGRPLIRFSEKISSLMKEGGFTAAQLSLSHDGNYALATVLLH